MRDDYGLDFWPQEIEVNSRMGGGIRPMPPIPDTGWIMPDDYPSLEGQGTIAIDVETYDPELKTRGPGAFRDGYICGVSIGTESGFRRYYPITHEMGENLPKDKVIAWLRRELKRPVPKIGANLLYDLAYFAAEGIEVTGPYYDVQVAEPLLNENKLSYTLESIAQDWLKEGKQQNVMKEWLVRAFGETNYKSNIYRAPATVVGPYAEGDVDLPLRVFALQRRELESRGLWDLFLLESRLIPLLLAMWRRGVRVDLDKAEQLYGKLAEQQVKTVAEIKRISGIEPDIWAAESLAKIFDAAGVPYLYTEKTNKPSFRKEWLAACTDPIAQLIMEARRLDKFKGTFVQGYILDGNVNGRIHCQFHQLRSDDGGTVSGRLSCVAGWTTIPTLKGTKQIKDVVVGDLVWTHQQRWQPVTATWLKGREQMLDVTLSNGNVLTCTISHKLLSSQDGWTTVEDLADAFFQKVGLTARQYIDSAVTLPRQGNIDHSSNSKKDENSFSQYSQSSARKYSRERIQSITKTSLFEVKDRQEKSDERKICREASQLEGRVRRQQRLFDYQTKWQTDFCTSSQCIAIIRHQEVADETLSLDDSSYRRRPAQQRPKQSSDCNQQRTQGYSFPDATGREVVTIKEINFGGCHEVYDITVAEDESYLSCGVFSHNSSKPNLQNIPIRDPELGPLIRSMFIAELGQRWWKFDWSQIEFRLAIHHAARMKLKGAQAIVDQYMTDPTTDYHKVVATITGLTRSAAKNLNFGIIYGLGIEAMAAGLKVDLQTATRMYREYLRRVPFIGRLRNAAMSAASDTGIITTLLGRQRHFDVWEKGGLYFNEPVKGGKRAFTHKALNARLQGDAADIMKQAMVDSWEAGVFDYIGAPHLTVHDELDGSEDESPIALEALRELQHIMETCVKLSLPLKAEGGTGPNWGSIE